MMKQSLRSRLANIDKETDGFHAYLEEIKNEITALLNTTFDSHMVDCKLQKNESLLSYGMPANLRWAIDNKYKQVEFLKELSQLIMKNEPRLLDAHLEYSNSNYNKDHKTHLILHGYVDYSNKLTPVSIHVYCYAIQRKYFIN